MEWMINSPDNSHWMWLVVATAATMLAGAWLRRRAMKRFAALPMHPHLLGAIYPGVRVARSLLVLLAMIALVIALMDVRWGRQNQHLPQRGIDLMFAVDVSRSMLADDAAPCRLERAKQYIRDLADQTGGDRVGLVAFAGSARQIVPLTSNLSDLTMALQELGPYSVYRGGSDLGQAIRTAAAGFLDKTPDHKAIVLLTDGENHTGDPVAAAKAILREKGIRTYTVAIGDNRTGARIPLRSTPQGTVYLQHDDQDVWSKMNGRILRETALAGQGAYIPAGTKRVDMGELYRRHIEPIAEREFSTAEVNTWIPRYPWPAGLALVCMLLAAAMNDQRRAMSYRQSLRRMWQKRTDRPVRASHAHRRGVARPRKTHAAILAALLSTAALTGVASADPAAAEAYADYNRGVALYKQGQFEKAAAVFKGVLPRADRTLDAAARYNWGNCAYARGVAQARAGQVDPAIASLDEAIGHYRQALAVHPDDADARANVELASLLIRQLKEDKQQQQQKDQQKDQQKKDQPQKNQDSPKQQDQQTNQDQQQKTTDQQNKQNDQPQDRQQQAPQDQDDAGKQQQHNSQGDQPPEHPQARKDDPSDSQQPKESSQNQDPQQAKKDQQVSDSPQDQQDTPPQEPQDQAQAYKSKPDGSPPPSGPPGQPGQPGQPNSGQTAAGEAARVERARQDGDVTAQEAARLLQAVRDRHLQRRIQTFRNRQARHEPVDQDW